MKRIKETLTTVMLAAKLSLAFCLRNARRETVGRLVTATTTTILGYGMVQVTGLLVNAVQKTLESQLRSGEAFQGVIHSNLLRPILLLIAITVIGVVVGRFNWYYKSSWNHKLRDQNRKEINDHRATLDVARFRSKDYDDLTRKVRELSFGEQTRIVFAEQMFLFFTTIISFVLFGTALLWYKPAYAVVLLITAIPMAVVEFEFVSKWWNTFMEFIPHNKLRSVSERAYLNKNEFTQAKMFNQPPILRMEIDKNTRVVRDSYSALRMLAVRKEMITHLIAVTGLCGVIIHAVVSIVSQGGAIGTFTILLASSRMFQNNLESIVSLVSEQWNSVKGVILIEKEFFTLTPMFETDLQIQKPTSKTPRIIFDKVSFSYPGKDVRVLEDVSFSIEPGSKVAIVGKSGNGKSTIQKLLTKEYPPTAGVIYADDINLTHIHPREWSNFTAALTQNYSILNRTVGAEIASSRMDMPIDDEAVKRASAFSGFAEVIELEPEVFNTQIGVDFGGKEFSGGEDHRLALARVFYRNSPILILDEPDVRLDAENAEKVMENLFALTDTTVVLITHNLAQAQRCDKIIVMGKGKVLEQGTHSELMDNRGPYFRTYSLQQKRIVVEAEFESEALSLEV